MATRYNLAYYLMWASLLFLATRWAHRFRDETLELVGIEIPKRKRKPWGWLFGAAVLVVWFVGWWFGAGSFAFFKALLGLLLLGEPVPGLWG